MREQILAFLEKNSNINLAEMAIMLGTTEAVIANEIQKMEQEQVICGYHTLIDWEKTSDEKVTAQIGVKISPVRGEGFEVLCETIKKTAFKVTRVGQLVAQEASRRLGVPLGIIDLSLAPTPAVGDSVAEILEVMGLARCGAHGSTAALAMLTDAVKKGGIMASGHVGGLSGAFIPVSEDRQMIASAEEGCLTFDKLEAMTSVCSVGLDMIAIPGDTPEDTISAIIADEAAIGVINNKTTAVRVIPVYGMKAGDKADWGGLFGASPVMEVNQFSSSDFIQRGGRIPAPVHSFKN